MGNIVEIVYDIESRFDEYGRFPLDCLIKLFDLLEYKSNILIKNRFTARNKSAVVKKIIENNKNVYYEDSSFPAGEYCIWIKDNIKNEDLIEVLSLQGIYMCCIQPTDTFDWTDFQTKWKKDETYLLVENQASLICAITDEDRFVDLYFNDDYYPIDFINDVLCRWESLIESALPVVNKKKIVDKFRSKIAHIKIGIELYFD